MDNSPPCQPRGDKVSLAATPFDRNYDRALRNHGFLPHIFKGTPKLDVRTETGLDDLLAIAKPAKLEEEKAGGSRIVLADFGGGNEEDTVRWFNEMYDGLVGHDISFLGIGPLDRHRSG